MGTREGQYASATEATGKAFKRILGIGDQGLWNLLGYREVSNNLPLYMNWDGKNVKPEEYAAMSEYEKKFVSFVRRDGQEEIIERAGRTKSNMDDIARNFVKDTTIIYNASGIINSVQEEYKRMKEDIGIARLSDESYKMIIDMFMRQYSKTIIEERGENIKSGRKLNSIQKEYTEAFWNAGMNAEIYSRLSETLTNPKIIKDKLTYIKKKTNDNNTKMLCDMIIREADYHVTKSSFQTTPNAARLGKETQGEIETRIRPIIQ